MKNKSTSEMSETKELSQIRRDFIQVVILNAVLLGVMIGLYLWNRSTSSLDTFFSQIIKF
jgi:hypothetical protein